MLRFLAEDFAKELDSVLDTIVRSRGASSATDTRARDRRQVTYLLDTNACVALLNTFLAGPLTWTLFDEDDAREAGQVRAELETAGRPIGAYDVLIAGQARRRGATVVTSNANEFSRVKGLKWKIGQ